MPFNLVSVFLTTLVAKKRRKLVIGYWTHILIFIECITTFVNNKILIYFILVNNMISLNFI